MTLNSPSFGKSSSQNSLNVQCNEYDYRSEDEDDRRLQQQQQQQHQQQQQ